MATGQVLPRTKLAFVVARWAFTSFLGIGPSPIGWDMRMAGPLGRDAMPRIHGSACSASSLQTFGTCRRFGAAEMIFIGNL